MVDQGSIYDIQAYQRLNGLQAELADVRKALESGGGGSGGDGLNARLAKVEASIEHIETDIGDIKSEVRTLRSDARVDFRLLFGAIITVAIALAGLMAKGFHWL